ncbi:MAG: hypothetical protein IIA88_02755 [Bacteroidetes bacterium]|nr:hypothetical protein [Bacteroidota bacterium]
MKNIDFIFFLIVLSLSISCRRNCICTEKGCPCPELTVSIQANVENYALGEFSEEEINEFYLIRTSQTFEIIDSIKMNFGYMAGNVDYNRYYWINQHTFNDFDDFRQYNLLIKNKLLQTIDTISQITYSENMEHVLCNECTNCDDEYVDCVQYSDFSLNFNNQIISDYQVRIMK